ncbi:hypothetical protein Emag_001560 [Eimeria magna]
MGIELPSAAATAMQPAVTHDGDSSVSRSPRHNEEEADGMENATVGQLQNAPPAAFNAKPRRKSHPSMRVGAAILVPLLVVFGITYFCMRLHRKADGVGIQQRRLAEGGEDSSEDDELEDVLIECLERHNKLLTEQADTGSADPLVRASKRLNLEMKVQELFHRLVQPSAASAHSSAAASSESALTAFEEKKRHRKRAAGTLVRPWLTPSRARSPTAPFALPFYPGGTGAETQKGMWTDPLPETVPLAAKATREGSEGGSSLALDIPSTSGAGLPISGDPVSQSSTPTLPWNPHEHPFTRLPMRSPKAATRDFIPGGFFHGDFSGRFSSSLLLNVIREILKVKTLGTYELNLLLRTTESLVHLVSRRATLAPASIKRPAHILTRLGWYFLVYDAIICAKEVLGPSMPLGNWWSTFTSYHKTDYSLRHPYGPHTKTYESVARHISLVHDLSQALAIYKQGIRPRKEVVLRLKMALLCDEDSPRRISQLYGPLYIQDHLDFLAANPDFARQHGYSMTREQPDSEEEEPEPKRPKQ